MTSRLAPRALGAAVLMAAAACSSDKLNVPNYNDPTAEGVAKDPQGIQLSVNGIIADERTMLIGFNRDLMIFGREGYNYFTTDGRTVSGYLNGIPGPQRLDPGGFASARWADRYQNMLNEATLIKLANSLPATALPAAAKAGVIGLAKTFRALDLFYVIQTRDSLGAPVDTPDDPATPPPFVSRDSVYKNIVGLLEEAKTSLGQAGGSFPVQLPAGFANFNTPATFLKLNRAILAKVQVFRATLGCGAACYTAAMTALGESFVSPVGAASSMADLNAGPYYDYGTGAGDQPNSNSYAQQSFIYAHAQYADSAKAHLQANGQPDARFLRKLAPNTPVNPPQNLNIAAVWHFTIYPSPSSPAPLIRNEELILLRAEAEIALGQLAAATTDLNTVRTISGGLAPLPAGLSAQQLFQDLIYEKWGSLLLEGSRWPDMRRWGLLDRLPIDKPGQFVARVMPIPQAECDARVQKPNGCQ